MTKYHEWNIEHPDLVCGGTPCQAFSVAGLRAGLADPRGNLALVFLGIVDHHRPHWVVWENVPGVYSSTSHEGEDPKPPDLPLDVGRDGHEVEEPHSYDADEDHAFACFLAGLQELGYGCYWRTLDAQYCGVAQRRRRCFLVGYLGDWRPAAAVLLEPESLSGNPAPQRSAGKGVAGTIAASTPSRRNGGSDPVADHFVTETAPALTNSGRGVSRAGESRAGESRGQDPIVAEVTHALRREGHDASEDGTGRGTPIVPVVMATGQANAEVVSDGSPSLTCNHEAPILAHAFKVRGGGNSTGERGGDTGATGGVGYMGQDDVAFTLSTDQDQHIAQPITIAIRGRDDGSSVETRQDGTSKKTGGGKPRQGYPAVLTGYAVRRLTPMEAERLQAFPDDYTKIPWKGKPAEECPDGPRYKAIGNSWCVNEVKKLARKIHMVEEIMAGLRPCTTDEHRVQRGVLFSQGQDEVGAHGGGADGKEDGQRANVPV